ncbi:MAG: helix-turn-helix domain-containing protein [Clostridia bacterium]|nr:helix-turn-helix domain-containing protein [Clostridia bacterium]
MSIVLPPDFLLTRQQLADLLKLHPVTLKKLGDKGPQSIKIGGAVRYRPQDVEAWLASIGGSPRRRGRPRKSQQQPLIAA